MKSGFAYNVVKKGSVTANWRMAKGRSDRFTTSQIPIHWKHYIWEKVKLCSFNILCITVVNEHNRTSVYGEIAF